MERCYRALVPFRAFFEVGLSPIAATGRRGSTQHERRLEAMNVPVDSLVMPWNKGLMVRRPGEEFMRGTLRCPRPATSSTGSFTPRGAMIYRRLMAGSYGKEQVHRRDADRLQVMDESGFLRELPPPDSKTDLVGFDYEPPMSMASRTLPAGSGGVVEIEPSHELTRFKADIEDLVALLDHAGAERVAFEDIGHDDVIRMRAECAGGYVVIASNPETYATWVECPLPHQPDLQDCLGGLVDRGEVPREEFVAEMRAGPGIRPGLGA